VAASAKTSKTRGRVTFRPLSGSKAPKVIPPRSVVILASVDRKTSPDWVADRGRMFRIGYYNPTDGLDCIWLVNDDGEYEQTTDRQTLLNHFVILKLSNEQDLYGARRPPLKPLQTKKKPAFAVPSLLAS
jgi:hypothetical protein